MDRKKKILSLLKKNTDGLTIIEIAKSIGVSRNTIPIILAELKGAKLIRVRFVGKCKLHYLEVKK
jgi:DNA-binding transcriptional ArsR family regulator